MANMNAPKISHTVVFANPDSPQRIASAGHLDPTFAACSGERYTWLASTTTSVMPIRPIAPPGSGSNIRPTMTPAKIAKYHHACCGSPSGGGMSARMTAMATGAAAFHQFFIVSSLTPRGLLPAHRDHLAADESDLGLQRQVLRADVVAGEQRHAAEDAAVVADHLVVVVVRALVARIEAEARDLVDPYRADEVLAHARGAAAGNAAAALDAAVEEIDLLGVLGLHALLDPLDVDLGRLHVHPSVQPLAHRAHPLAGVHGKIGDQLEDRQRRERERLGQVLGLGAAGEPRPAVDHHRAAPADAGATDEVELQGGVLLLADLVERDEERHAIRLLELVGLHARLGARLLRVEPQAADLEVAVLAVGHDAALFAAGSSKRSSMRSLRPRKRGGSRCS